MPLAVPVKLPDTPPAALVEDALPPHAVRNIAPARSSEARTFFFFMDTLLDLDSFFSQTGTFAATPYDTR